MHTRLHHAFNHGEGSSQVLREGIHKTDPFLRGRRDHPRLLKDLADPAVGALGQATLFKEHRSGGEIAFGNDHAPMFLLASLLLGRDARIQERRQNGIGLPFLQRREEDATTLAPNTEPTGQ